MKTVSKNTYTQQSEAEAEGERVEKQHLNLAIVLNDNAQLLFEATIRKRCRMKAKNAIPPKNIPIPFTWYFFVPNNFRPDFTYFVTFSLSLSVSICRQNSTPF